jgi:hypothetical protein
MLARVTTDPGSSLTSVPKMRWQHIYRNLGWVREISAFLDKRLAIANLNFESFMPVNNILCGLQVQILLAQSPDFG